MLKRRHLLGAILAAGLVSFVTGATQAADADALKQITIKIGQNNGELEPIWRASGIFDNAPYKVVFSSFNNALANYAGLAQGYVDISDSSAITALQLQQAAPQDWTADTAPIKGVIMRVSSFPGADDPYVIMASAKSGIKELNAETLKGKKFAFSPGANNYLVYVASLKYFGVKSSDLQPIVLDTTANALALLNNSVDLVSGTTGLYGAAMDTGAHVVSSSTKLGLPILSRLFANTKALDDPLKGAALADMVKRYVAFQDWFNTHPDEAQKAFVNGRQFTSSQAKIAWKSGRVDLWPINAAVLADGQKVNDLLFDAGDFKKKLNASVVFDARFTGDITQALAQSKYEDHLAASNAVGK